MKASGSVIGDAHVGVDGLGGGFHGVDGPFLVVPSQAVSGGLIGIAAIDEHGDDQAYA